MLSLKIGTNNSGEIGGLAALVAPDTGVITNVGYAHIGNFGSQEAIAVEKVSLFDHVPVGGACIINGDDALLSAIAELSLRGCGKRRISVGVGDHNDVWVESIESETDGTSGVVRHAEESANFFVGVPGRHFAYSALFAIAIALEKGIDLGSSANPLRYFVSPSGRSTLLRLHSDLVFRDA